MEKSNKLSPPQVSEELELINCVDVANLAGGS